jgi:cell wall-associated protease
MYKKTILVGLALAFSSAFFSQENKEIVNWYNGGKAGMQTDKAYKKLKKRKSTTVIVAVIDSGIDIEHEDLQGKIWTNSKEISGNGIDDDMNGYVDDIHGWNFLGNAKGENVDGANLEKTRILRRLSKKFDGIDGTTLSGAEKAEYALYEKVKTEVEQDIALYSQYIQYMEMMPRIMAAVPGQIETKLGKKDYTIKDLKDWKTDNMQDEQLKQTAMSILSGDLSDEVIKQQKKQIQDMLDYHLNVDYDERVIIGDNPNDFTDTNYGNPDVEGPDAMHGTHVGGIIGANRGNGKGGDGVAENVLLMSLRAVPNGDENDKDIALAVRYAVDNGASVINMSFGKAYSPNQKEVYEAFKYAESKGVLLVHAAGNDGTNLDEASNFPTNKYSFQAEPFNMWLTIGASTKEKKGAVAADFSNYSQTKVDIFAPGNEIYSTVPQSAYRSLQGTSMAAPMVSGVAAMLKSYFPTLTMAEIKTIILTSGKSYKGKMHIKPGSEDDKVDFGTLSTTGMVVNVKNAVKACKALEKSKMN